MLIYTDDLSKVDKEKNVYRNPKHFDGRIETKYAKDGVKVDGDYPHIIEAYENAGIKVIKPRKSKAKDDAE